MPDCCRICLAGGAERNSEEIDDEVGMMALASCGFFSEFG